MYFFSFTNCWLLSKENSIFFCSSAQYSEATKTKGKGRLILQSVKPACCQTSRPQRSMNEWWRGGRGMKQWGADKPQDQWFHSGSMQQNVSSSHFREDSQLSWKSNCFLRNLGVPHWFQITTICYIDRNKKILSEFLMVRRFHPTDWCLGWRGCV